MGKDRARPAHRVEHLRLPRGVGQVVVAPDHVRDAHVVVVHHHRQHVGRRPVRAQQHHVVELVVAERHVALHRVLDHRLAVARGAQADREGRVGAGRGVRVAPRACKGLVRMRRAPRLDLGGRGVAGVGAAVRHHLARDLGVAGGARELADGLAVPVKAEPRQPLQDRLRRFGRGTRAVGILDPQQEPAAPRACVEPVEQRGARAADMQIAGRRGRKARDDLRAALGALGRCGLAGGHGGSGFGLGAAVNALVRRGPLGSAQ